MRTLIIGDVHGCRHELEELVSKFAPVRGKDRMFQTGDLVNRGPDSLGAARFAKEHGIQSVMGNHEWRLVSIMARKPADRNPKEQAYLTRLGADPEELAELVKDFPFWIEDPDFTLVHAGLEPGKSRLEDMARKVLLTVRTWDGRGEDMDRVGDPPWFDLVRWPRTVVFGHWALGGLVEKPGFRGLDSGCVYGKSLSGWCVEEDRIIQVPAQKAYAHLNF